MPSDAYLQKTMSESDADPEGLDGNVKQFPDIEDDEIADANPAIRLFGRRFRDDQTEIEYLIELMLLFVSAKKIGKIRLEGYQRPDEWKGFPETAELQKCAEGEPLIYYPKMHLMIKLFAFLGASGIDGRHQSHLEKHEALVSNLKHHLNEAPSITKNEAIDLMEQVLMGFIGVSGTRVWSAHSFLPLAPELIAGEAIWEKTKGKREPNLKWHEVWEKKMFSFSKHDFLARGGELLYLQLCNLFRLADDPALAAFEKQIGYSGAASDLQRQIEANLKDFLTRKPAPILNQIGQWIEKNEGEAPVSISREEKGAECGWCPVESWREAYLFATELRNISGALLDPMEKLEMLKFCCVFQVLRSLSAQAGRYWRHNPLRHDENAVLPFAWIITDPDLTDRALKTIARKNLLRVKEMFHAALRTRCIQTLKNGKKTYRNADKQGTDLFIKLAKNIGLVAPKTGPGARFVLRENLLRYLVLALVPPGARMRLTTFLKLLHRHYGAAISGTLLDDAIAWTSPEQRVQAPSERKKWLEDKLLATGFLIPLSDAVSLIHNPFSEEPRKRAE